MQVTILCRKMERELMTAIYRWAKRLEADEMIIHKDGTISLYCEYGGICERYRPSAREIYR